MRYEEDAIFGGDMQKKENEERIIQLDFIRVISTVLIVIFHYNIQLGFHNVGGGMIFWQQNSTQSIGSLGITLFIMLSGAGLMCSCNKGFDIKTYYMKRLTRILIPYYIAYIITFIFLTYIYGQIPVNAPKKTFVLTIIGLDGFLYEKIPNFYLCGEWFVGFIIVLYLIFPFIIWLKNSKKLIQIIAGVLFILLYCYEMKYNILGLDPIHDPILRLPDFIFGMMFMQIYIHFASARTIRRIIGWISIAAFFILLFSKNIFSYITISHILGALLFTAIFCLCDLSNTINREELVTPVTYLSTISFDIILLHHNIIAVCLEHLNNRIINVIGLYAVFAFICFIIVLASKYLNYAEREVLNFFKILLKKEKK